MATIGPLRGHSQRPEPTRRSISLRATMRRLFALTSSDHHPRTGGMFDRAQNTSIRRATFTINNYGEIVTDHPRAGRQPGQDASALSPSEEFDPPPSPRRESPDVYVDCLLTKNRGYPLWIPSPNTSLPKLNRRRGISYGDVGVLTPEGGFDFLFNIVLDAADQINSAVGVPDGFVPFTPAVGADSEFIEWNAGSYLADPSIIRVDNGCDRLKTILEATGPEAAILMIPEEIRTARLRITIPLREYVEENIASWYEFVRHTLGYDIENGDLRVVYACRKSSGFGIATAFNSARRENTRLTFSVDSTWEDISGCPYRWSHTGSAEVKAGPSRRENTEISVSEPVRNQCLFVSTIDVKLSAEIWKNIENLGIAKTLDGHSHRTVNTTQPQGGSAQRPTGTSNTEETTSIYPTFHQYHERTFHPSAILLNTLETIVPGLAVYMTCDDDWADVITTKNMSSYQFVTQVLKKRIVVEHQGMAYFSDDVNRQAQDRSLNKEPVAKTRFIWPTNAYCNVDDGFDRWRAIRTKHPHRSTSDEHEPTSPEEPRTPTGGNYGSGYGDAGKSSQPPTQAGVDITKRDVFQRGFDGGVSKRDLSSRSQPGPSEFHETTASSTNIAQAPGYNDPHYGSRAQPFRYLSVKHAERYDRLGGDEKVKVEGDEAVSKGDGKEIV